MKKGKYKKKKQYKWWEFYWNNECKNQIKHQEKNKSAVNSNNAQLFSDPAATQDINGCIVFK